jgi:hypothetical protein
MNLLLQTALPQHPPLVVLLCYGTRAPADPIQKSCLIVPLMVQLGCLSRSLWCPKGVPCLTQLTPHRPHNPTQSADQIHSLNSENLLLEMALPQCPAPRQLSQTVLLEGCPTGLGGQGRVDLFGSGE